MKKIAGYIAYNLSSESRAQLLRRFPPHNENVVAHHITYQFGGVSSETPLPPEASIEVVGYAYNDNIECAVVKIAGKTERADGSTFHITLSHKNGTAPKMSNDLLKEKGWEPILGPFPIQAKPTFNAFGGK